MQRFYILFIIFYLTHFACLAQTPDWLWAKSALGEDDEYGESVVTDGNGNVLVTGAFWSDSITFGTITLSNTNTNLSSDIFVVKYDPSGNVLWAKSAGGTDVDFGKSIATDADGNVLVTGSFYSSSLSFGTDTFTNPNGGENIFIVKYDPLGNVLWSTYPEGVSGAYGGNAGKCISTDADRNVLITGYFSTDSIRFATNTLTNPVSGFPHVFVAKYDPSGNALWGKFVGMTDNLADIGIATDANKNILITGTFQSFSITLGATTLTNAQIGSNDIFIAKYDSSGNILWAKSAGGKKNDYGESIATDIDGNIFVTGSFRSDSIKYGTTTLVNNGYSDLPDIFIVKYDCCGNVLWAKSAGGRYWDEGFGVATDAGGNAMITGSFNNDSLALGTVTLQGGGLFIAKYDPWGNTLWAESVQGLCWSNSVATDASGNALLTGSFMSNTANFGTIDLCCPTVSGVFVAKVGELTGIAENADIHVAELYPNPATCELYIVSSKPVQQVRVYGIEGNLITEINQPPNNLIDISKYSSGIYFYELRNDKEVVKTGKFVKQ